MNRVFGKKKAPGPPAPSLTEVSGSMAGRIDDMEAKIAKLEKELKTYKDKIRSTRSPAVKKNLQKKAMDILKRKRMYEQQRDTIASQQFNIDQASFGIESAKANIGTVAAMKEANAALKQTIKQDLKLDDIEDITDEMADMMDDFNEINEALATNFATPDDVDEIDLEAELEMLEDELEDDVLEADSTPSYLQQDDLPVQPSATPESKVQDTEDEYGLPISQT